jgi:hypothetical protein
MRIAPIDAGHRNEHVSRLRRYGGLVIALVFVVNFQCSTSERFIGLVQLHPYQNAYLNEVTNAWIAGNAEDVFEVEYWGQSYKEGAEWLNDHSERDADICVGLAQRPADRYLMRKSSVISPETLPRFEDQRRPAHLMLMTRKALYRPEIEHVVRRYEPIFAVRRQKGILLNVYSNRRLAAREASPSEMVGSR